MNATTLWEWVKALPFGAEIRRYTAPEHYIAYRRRMRVAVSILVVPIVLELFYSPLPHAPLAVRIAWLAAVAACIGVWIAASIRYVLAWDELQRRVLAESGAITAVIQICVFAIYAFFERLFAAPPLTAMVWFTLGAALWLVSLPLIRRHYES